jgi:sulfur-oxidizing protein SoxX
MRQLIGLRFLALLVCQALIVAGAVSAATTAVTESTLAPYTVVDGAIPASLTGTPGDPVNGKVVAVTRSQGNCLTCHKMPVPDADQGTLAPDLRGIGALRTEGQLRLRIVNPKLIYPQTIMPAYYRIDGLHLVDKPYAGKPMLTAQQVEDLVAYLATLK